MSDTVTIHHGNCAEIIHTLADGSMDSCVTDPPYALVSIVKRSSKAAHADDTKTSDRTRRGADGYARLAKGFMGKAWDNGDVAFEVSFWAEVLRVLKPGAHLIAFGGTRTYHRLACAIEDAGFEIRDQIGWLYGSGFPKSHDVSKGIDKAAGATREVIAEGEPVKRMIPGADQNKQGWEKNNGREFVPTVTKAATPEAQQWEGWGTALKPAWEPIVLARKPLIGTVAENVLAHGTGALNIEASRIEFTGDADKASAKPGGKTTAASGNLAGKAQGGAERAEFEAVQGKGRWPANVIHDGSDEVRDAFPSESSVTGRRSDASRNAEVAGTTWLTNNHKSTEHLDSGSPARFFYSAKADAGDRLESKHPTVKPVDLMVYLVRMITPPGGTVLDPFAGSGTTGMACMREGFKAVLIEREAEYVADIRRRLAHVQGLDSPLFAGLA